MRLDIDQKAQLYSITIRIMYGIYVCDAMIVGSSCCHVSVELSTPLFEYGER